jgi:Trk-type K+ transport system membrane component
MKSSHILASVLLLAMVLLMFDGFVVLRSDAATVRGNEMNVDRAVFNVANAATLSGFQLSVNVRDYKLPGQQMIFALIVAGSLVSLIVGGIFLSSILRMRFNAWQIAGSAIVIWLAAVFLGAGGLLRVGTGNWPAIFQAASAFGNDGHFIGELPGWMDWRMHLILLPLGLLGGLGILVVMEIMAALFGRRRLHPYTIAVLAMTAAIYLIGVIVVATIQWLDGSAIRESLIVASSAVMNCRTLGFPLETFGMLARPAQWVVLLLMAIGGSGAGTAGGIKITTVFGIGRGAVRAIRGKPIDRVLGVISGWFLIYCLMVLATTISLLAAQPQAPADRMLFLAVSALSNVGISHEPITFTGVTLYILTAAMLLGRFVPLGLVWWAAACGVRGDSVGA